jgi:hypothetical protein
MPTLAATSAIGFIVAARAISMSDLMVTGLVPPSKSVLLAALMAASVGPLNISRADIVGSCAARKSRLLTGRQCRTAAKRNR